MKQNPLPYCIATNMFPLVLWVVASIFLFSTGAWAENNVRPFRIGLPQSIFHLQYGLITDWQQYLQRRLHRSVEIISNRKAVDFNVQLHIGKLDFVWVTDYPNALIGPQARLLAVPLYKQRPFIASYLIVPASDTKTTTLMQLKGTVMVFADSTSNSHIEQRYVLLKSGENPNQFFRKVFFTHSHNESIKAVILGLADAAEIDNFVWDTMVQARPELTLQTRIAARSQEFGAPPLVANHFVSNEEFADMRSVLVGMSKDAEGLKLLKRMSLDGFAPGEEKFYESIVQMKKAMGEK